MQGSARSVLQRIIAGALAAGLCLFLTACAPVQAVTPTPEPRAWFTQAELEQALIDADVNPDLWAAGLCSADPSAADRYYICVEYRAEPLPEPTWEARWDMARQRVRIDWRRNVEVQFD